MQESFQSWKESLETFALEVIFHQRRGPRAALMRAVLFALSKLFEVIAIVRKPRTVYMCANEGSVPSQTDPTVLLGAPAFASDGGFAGVWAMSKAALLSAPAAGEMPTPEPPPVTCTETSGCAAM